MCQCGFLACACACAGPAERILLVIARATRRYVVCRVDRALKSPTDDPLRGLDHIRIGSLGFHAICTACRLLFLSCSAGRSPAVARGATRSREEPPHAYERERARASAREMYTCARDASHVHINVHVRARRAARPRVPVFLAPSWRRSTRAADTAGSWAGCGSRARASS